LKDKIKVFIDKAKGFWSKFSGKTKKTNSNRCRGDIDIFDSSGVYVEQ